jgi:hypothetical protein
MVTTGAAGTQAGVTNSGTAGAAVLNFTIPQGAAGAGGGGAVGGTAFAAVYHAVSFSFIYYSVSGATAAASEMATPAVLTWVPAACTATGLSVLSQQGNTITVTLRAGPMGSLADTVLSCTAAAGGSCTAAGSVAVAAGGFVDLSVTGANGAVAAVWTALGCS